MIQMNKMLLVFAAVMSSMSISFSQFSLDLPEYVIEGVGTKVEVTFEEEASETLRIGSHNYSVQQGDDGHFIEIEFYRNQMTKFEAFGAVPAVIPSWWAVVPPLVAIIMALLIKEVLVALLMGIFIGAATLGFYTGGFSGIFSGFLAVLDHYILSALNDPDHLSVVLFSLLIGSIVAVISKNGGMRGVVNRIVKYAQTRRSGMFTTYFLGIAIFFDDYAI